MGVMCRLLSVSKSGFYAWDGRPMSPHARRDVELTALMHQIHERSYRSKPKRWAPDLVERNFVADRPDALWVADVTYVPTAEGWLYLAIVLDVFSRLVVGWAMAERLASELVRQALDMAYAQRGPRDVVHHSDHGSTPRLRSAGAAGCSVCAHPWVASAIASIMRWRSRSSRLWNVRRRHSSIGYVSPQEFEKRFNSRYLLPSPALLPQVKYSGSKMKVSGKGAFCQRWQAHCLHQPHIAGRRCRAAQL